MTKNLTRRDACASLAALALGASARQSHATPPSLEVAFVYVSPIGDAGWTFQHELGRREMELALGPAVTTVAVESVAEGADAERVMRDLAARGAKLVFATSFGYGEPALRVAAEFPATVFEHAGGYRTAANVGTYDARYSEARWLAGWLAGQASRSGIAGYVAGFPIPEVVQGIDAFALGMRAAAPGAQVRVVWLDAWFDPPRERGAAQSLIDGGADVLTHHSASPAVAQAAQSAWKARRVRVVPYPSDMRAYAPDAQLAAIVHRWGGFYTRTARHVVAGTWKPEAVWGGIGSGMVDLVAVDSSLPRSVRDGVSERRADIVAGRLRPFSGRIVDRDGAVRLASGALDDSRIRAMDWFVRGVAGALPKAR